MLMIRVSFILFNRHNPVFGEPWNNLVYISNLTAKCKSLLILARLFLWRLLPARCHVPARRAALAPTSAPGPWLRHAPEDELPQPSSFTHHYWCTQQTAYASATRPPTFRYWAFGWQYLRVTAELKQPRGEGQGWRGASQTGWLGQLP